MSNATDSLISITSTGSNLSRRKARSQVLYDGDNIMTLSEQNKQLVQDIFYLKKVISDYFYKTLIKFLTK